MKVALFAPNWIGDLVMSHSLIQAIKTRYPHACLHVYAPQPAVQIAELMQEVDCAFSLPFVHGKIDWRARRAFARASIRTQRYDMAFVLPNSLKSALLPWMADIPVRVGWLGEWRYGLLTHARRAPKTALPLHASRYQALIELLHDADNTEHVAWQKHSHPLQPQLRINPQNMQQIAHLLPKEPFVALCPGAAFGSAKCWPPVHFSALADMIAAHNIAVVLIGDAGDAAVLNAIITQCARQDRVHSLAGKTTLVQASMVLTQARAVVCNDSGLMHMAAALDVPLVAIYGPTSSQQTPPLGKRCILLEKSLSCRPCHKRTCPLKHHKCMQEMTPSEVYQALASIIQ